MTDSKIVHLSDLHSEHLQWMEDLRFYKDEVGVFEHRLEEIATKNNHVEVKAEVQKFESQFIRQKEVVDILGHDIKVKEHELVEFAQSHNQIAINHTRFQDHSSLKDRVDTFFKLFKDMKNDFQGFSSKWM